MLAMLVERSQRETAGAESAVEEASAASEKRSRCRAAALTRRACARRRVARAGSPEALGKASEGQFREFPSEVDPGGRGGAGAARGAERGSFEASLRTGRPERGVGRTVVPPAPRFCEGASVLGRYGALSIERGGPSSERYLERRTSSRCHASPRSTSCGPQQPAPKLLPKERTKRHGRILTTG